MVGVFVDQPIDEVNAIADQVPSLLSSMHCASCYVPHRVPCALRHVLCPVPCVLCTGALYDYANADRRLGPFTSRPVHNAAGHTAYIHDKFRLLPPPPYRP